MGALFPQHTQGASLPLVVVLHFFHDPVGHGKNVAPEHEDLVVFMPAVYGAVLPGEYVQFGRRT